MHRVRRRACSGAADRAAIPLVALGDLPRKGGKTNSESLFFQLLMSPPGPFLGAGGQEDLEPGAVGKITVPMSRPSATRPGGPGESPLALEQGRAHRRQRGDPRGALSPAASARIRG